MVDKITTPPTAQAQIDKINEIIDNLSSSGTSYTATCPAITPVDGVATWSVTHNLGTQVVITELYSSSGAKIEHNTSITSNNEVTITFVASSNVSAGDYTIVVMAGGASSTNTTYDGQWVNSWSELYQAEDCPPSTDVDISLSSYLPNDSYNYEILVSFGLYTNTDQPSQVRIEFSTGLANSVRVIDSISRTGLRTLHNNTCILPISNAHTITLKGISWSQKGQLTVTAFAYRRLGTNA